jgi:hypothetical protein
MPLAYCSTRYLFEEEIKHLSALRLSPNFFNILEALRLNFSNKIWGLGTE